MPVHFFVMTRLILKQKKLLSNEKYQGLRPDGFAEAQEVKVGMVAGPPR